MKKITSLIIAVAMSIAITGQLAAASAAPTGNGLVFWVDAGAENAVETTQQLNSYKLDKWLDISGSEKHLFPSGNSFRPTFYPDSTKSDLKGNLPAVHFAKNQYLTASDINYSGDASFIVYYRQLSWDEGGTVFSSHSYVGDEITEAGKIPFSIVTTADKSLAFKMSSEKIVNEEEGTSEINLLDMNVPFELSPGNEEENLYNGYMALYVTIDADTKTVNVYNSRAIEQNEISAPTATFTLSQVPYWEAYAFGTSYETKGKGIVGDFAESMVYNRTLSLDEINEINKYLKLKYEYPVLSRLALANEIYEMKKGTIVEPEIIGVGVLMGVESRIDVTNAAVKSSDESVIIVINNSLKALNFGSAKITLSYEGLPDYSFVVNVPQTVINEPVVSGADASGVISVSEKIENYKEENTLSVIVVAALYENDLLHDISLEKAEIAAEYTFDFELTKPENADGCKVHVMILDGETMVPLNDAFIK